MAGFKYGTRVQWQWGEGTGEGQVRRKFTDRVTLTLQGTDVTRNASDDEPAYLLEQEDGTEVLKSASELRKAN